VPDLELNAYVEQIRAEAALLRRAAREADLEMATMVAATRRKRRWEQEREEAAERQERLSAGPAPRTSAAPRGRKPKS
jgi:hypothetical protein